MMLTPFAGWGACARRTACLLGAERAECRSERGSEVKE